MKKRIVIIISVIVVFISALLVCVYNTDEVDEIYEETENTMLALTLDGERVYEFPSKGKYQVDVDCTNGTGTWDYSEWKLSITDFTDDKVYCDIEFTSIDTTYLNNYVTSLVGTTQGDGKVIDENAFAGDYTSVTALSQSKYGTTSQYSSSSYSSTSGTSGTYWSYSDGVWTSDASSMSAGTYYHLTTTVQEEGYYQMCYTMSTGHNNNYLYVYIDDEIQYIGGTEIYLAAYGITKRSGCVELGYIESGSEVRFVQHAYSGTFYGVVTMTVDLELGTEVNLGSSGIRYEGENPNNYVWFNDELWRIIGVFDENTHGVSGEYLTKIVRYDSIGSLAWDTSNSNGWVVSGLNNILNNYYYYSLDGTDSGYCYTYSGITTNCDYTNTGISDTYRSMIENVTWYLGGVYSIRLPVGSFYKYERSGEYVYLTRSTSTTGYIGLMYASDYGYSILSDKCDRMTTLKKYYSDGCTIHSWMTNFLDDFSFINPMSTSYSGIIMVSSASGINDAHEEQDAQKGFNILPTLYLSSSVYVLDGDGSLSDPYIIGMD